MKLWNDNASWIVEGEEELLAWLRSEAERENGPSTVDFVLVDDDHIAELNEHYLRHEGVTDVIAFDLRSEADEEMEFLAVDEEDVEDSEGEVYVCLEQAARQANEYQASLVGEVSRLLLHGLLHLSGWRDSTDDERSRMHRREDEGLARAQESQGEFAWSVAPNAAPNGGQT